VSPRWRVVLVRHAESEGNAAGRWQGQSGAALTPRGHQQAAALATGLADLEGVTVVARSDLRRVAETAAPLLARTGWPEHVDARWRELDVGCWTGRAVEEVRRAEPDRFAAFRSGTAPAGGDGESLPDLRARLRAACEELLVAHASGTLLAVTHGWALRAAVAELTASAPGAERTDFHGVGNTAVCTLVGDALPLAVTGYDDQSHLPPELRSGRQRVGA